jgi:hypothetical protein
LFHRIGKGATACVKKKCQTNHGKTITLTPNFGMLFTLQTPTTVFIDPMMDSGLLLDKLFSKWMHGERATIKSWRIVFSLAFLIDSAKVTKERMMAKSKAHGERAAEYRTPSKAPGGFDFHDQTIQPELEEFVYVVKRVSDPEVFASSLATSPGLLRLSQVVGELESQSIDGATAIRTLLHEVVSLELLDGWATVELLNTKIDQTQSRLGSASEEMNPRWNSPTLWGMVSEMTSFLDILGDGIGSNSLMEEQEYQIKKLVSDLVEVQAKMALGRFREGLVEQSHSFCTQEQSRTLLGLRQQSL